MSRRRNLWKKRLSKRNKRRLRPNKRPRNPRKRLRWHSRMLLSKLLREKRPLKLPKRRLFKMLLLLNRKL